MHNFRIFVNVVLNVEPRLRLPTNLKATGIPTTNYMFKCPF